MISGTCFPLEPVFCAYKGLVPAKGYLERDRRPDFALVNQVMADYFQEPYPARAAIGVASLPRGAGVEMDAVMELG